ncbi:hypothetical protein JCM18899A_33370 [Nocardioides sp. AN3]
MSNRRIVLPGVIIGVLLLALAIVFAVVLPKAHGDSGDVSLPDTLPGGYTATDLVEAYKHAPNATDTQVQQASAAARTARSYGDKALKDSGVTAATRTYIDKKLSTPLFVQVFKASGGAFSPFEFSDPASAQSNQQVQRLVRKGDVVCIENGSADGQGGVQASYVQCQKSEGNTTVQVTSPLELAKAVALVDDVFNEVA